MENGEHSADGNWQPRPGQPHPVDKAFYDLTVKERDYERVKVDRLERQLRGAVDALEDFIAEVAAPSGRLRLEKHTEGDVLYEAVKRTRATLAALRGQ